MTETSVEIIGIIVNVVIGLFNAVLMIWLGRRQIQATLQVVQPTPKPKRKRKLTRAQRRWVMIFRLIQYITLTSPINHGYIDYMIWCCSDAGTLFRIAYFLVAGFSYLGSLIVFVQSHRYIKRIKARDRATLIKLGALKPREPKQTPETTEQ